MTQEEKSLLLKDLCARLPYGVFVLDMCGRKSKLTLGHVDLCSMFYGEEFDVDNCQSYCQPYLRPLSSMTEEEKKELDNILEFQYYSDESCMCESTDWLNAHHFDYRHLIDKGLAISVTKENNPYE